MGKEKETEGDFNKVCLRRMLSKSLLSLDDGNGTFLLVWGGHRPSGSFLLLLHTCFQKYLSIVFAPGSFFSMSNILGWHSHLFFSLISPVTT